MYRQHTTEHTFKRPEYQIWTVNHLPTETSNDRVFSSADIKTAFLALDAESSLLTNFNGWNGKKCLSVALVYQLEFQRRIDENIEGLEDVKAIADGSLIWDDGEGIEETIASHGKRLLAMLERCQLTQRGHPIQYASRKIINWHWKTLQPNWERYANYCIFLTRFHTYTYGREVTFYNHHKPLDAVLKKPAKNNPVRLQRIMGYDVEFKYVKGKDLLIADALNRSQMNNKTQARSNKRLKRQDWFIKIRA